ncbi:hypothetical protein NE261_10270 [Enterococcus italicus]|uniref:Beta-1,6-galactofuranosyltransferase n=1 Tax=Enterococcus italicus (strain DSM 15952 / CCUG 50447 / LMG 22039 / TP 1.5) TaxID=888064 RepID=E6LD59_ENTI1|nr:hypothetical protein [Enterococcus italicus]EFU74840.1 hypothetical protein HMPREF9088_0299 [Enterococcus italicus DSM 15952]MCM6932167.1 hypothetical protein [Enterococcus italicus]OJG58259.1 galactofuranosyltransferase [Enterococcus italicus DSM 15952]
MQKYILTGAIVNNNENKTAGSKAKDDIITILSKLEAPYKSIFFQIGSKKTTRIASLFKIVKQLKTIRQEDLIVYQYPFYSRFTENFILGQLKKKKCKKYIIIHDVESLRLHSDDKNFKDWEISFFNQFDGIISHNLEMTRWLTQNGIQTSVVNLELFDYIVSENEQLTEKKDLENKNLLSFAGNLGKSIFLTNLKLVDFKLELFGINPADSYDSNIIYKGSELPEELPLVLNGRFGIVWDGTSIDYCDGIMGEYLKYNNPHKASLYLAAGIPIITWSKSAIGMFITEKKLGFVVDSLVEIESLLSKMTEEEYKLIQNNVIDVSSKISSGYYVKRALENSIK